MTTQNASLPMPVLPGSPFPNVFPIPARNSFQGKTRHRLRKRDIDTDMARTAVNSTPDLLEKLHDFELIDKTIAGDRTAFGVLVSRYNHQIYLLAYRILRNQDDAADIAQDVFLKAFEALNSFRKKSSFHTWLYRITSNSCINFLRKHDARRYIELTDNHMVQETDTLEILHKIELQDVVNEAIKKLPEKQKTTVMLRVCEGLSHREISRILKCSVGTAKANYFHAIRNLRRFMKSYIAANDDDDVIPAGTLRHGRVFSLPAM